MNSYKFTKNSRVLIKEYATLTEAQNFADIYDGGGWNVENLGAVAQKTPEQLLQDDVDFLKDLMANFVILNRADNISPAESSELLTAFNNIKQLSEVGAVPEVQASIAALVPPIARVYTLQRQTDDLAAIAAYMLTRQ